MASVSLIYALVNIVIGVIVGILYPEDMTDLFQILCIAAIVAIVAIVISTPINLVLYRGYTGNKWEMRFLTCCGRMETVAWPVQH